MIEKLCHNFLMENCLCFVSTSVLLLIFVYRVTLLTRTQWISLGENYGCCFWNCMEANVLEGTTTTI